MVNSRCTRCKKRKEKEWKKYFTARIPNIQFACLPLLLTVLAHSFGSRPYNRRRAEGGGQRFSSQRSRANPPPSCCSLRGSDGLPIKDASRWLTKGGHNSRARVLGSSRSLAGRANTVVLRRVAPKRTAVRVQREEEEEEEDKKAGGERESSPRHLPTL